MYVTWRARRRELDKLVNASRDLAASVLTQHSTWATRARCVVAGRVRSHAPVGLMAYSHASHALHCTQRRAGVYVQQRENARDAGAAVVRCLVDDEKII